jgi:hypothetical protein
MFSLAVANNSRLAPRLHLLVSIDQKVVEILNVNESEAWIFHVDKSVERHPLFGGKADMARKYLNIR